MRTRHRVHCLEASGATRRMLTRRRVVRQEICQYVNVNLLMKRSRQTLTRSWLNAVVSLAAWHLGSYILKQCTLAIVPWSVHSQDLLLSSGLGSAARKPRAPTQEPSRSGAGRADPNGFWREVGPAQAVRWTMPQYHTSFLQIFTAGCYDIWPASRAPTFKAFNRQPEFYDAILNSA